MRFLLSILSLVCLSFTSCIGTQNLAEVYYPNPATIPSLDHKNEVIVNASHISFSEVTKGLAFQIAGSPLDHFGLLGSYTFQEKVPLIKNDFDRHKIESFEIGLGVYKGKSEEADHLFNFDAYAGMGFQNGQENRMLQEVNPNNGLRDAKDMFDAKSREVWGQVGLHYNKRRNLLIRLGGTIRITHGEIYEIEHVSNFRSLDLANPRFTSLQIGHDFRMGWEYFLIKAQLGMIVFMDSNSEENAQAWVSQDARSGIGYFSIGLEVPLEKPLKRIFKRKN